MEDILYTALDYYKGIEFSDFYNSSMRAAAIGMFLSLFLTNLLSYLAIKIPFQKKIFSEQKTGFNESCSWNKYDNWSL